MSYKYVLRDEEFKMRTPRLPSLTDVHAFYVLAYVYLAPAIADEVIIIIICKFIERHIMCLQKATEVYVFVASVFVAIFVAIPALRSNGSAVVVKL